MKRKLLMIEDDEQIRLVVARFLKRKDWDFHGAGDGAEGLAKAAAIKPDIVVLDIQLPDTEGWEVCKALKAHPELGGVPVIMVSGNRNAGEDKARGLEVGAEDFLSKPFDLTELVLRMDGILKSLGR